MDIKELKKTRVFDHTRVVLRKHVSTYDERFGSKNTMSRARDWQTFRMCTRDMVLAMIVLRKEIKNNVIEVDVCMIDNIAQFEEYYSTMVALSVIFSEAFQRATKMEIHFKKNVERGRVPQCICDYAAHVGLQLKHVDRGVLLPSESRLLYLSITELSKTARAKVIALHGSKSISVERVCFMVHNGVWSKEEMESILLGHQNPASLLLGEFPPEFRIPFLIDNAYARMAILGGAVDRIVKSRAGTDMAHVEALENDREVAIQFEPQHCMKVYRCMDEDITLPWLVLNGDHFITIGQGEFAFVRLMPRSISEMGLLFMNDLRTYAQQMIQVGNEIETCHEKKVHHIFVVPADFQGIAYVQQEEIISEAKKYGVYIILFPHSIKFLDEQSLVKFNMSRRLPR